MPGRSCAEEAHRQGGEELDQGVDEQHLSADEVVAAFVAKYGQQSLMAPPKEGFNWAGYLLPGVAITLVGSVLGWVLLRRARAPVAVGDAAVTGVLSTDDEARLRTELDKLES